MKYIKKLKHFLKDDFILENKDQALSILKKSGISEDNENFKRLRSQVEKVFNNLNYLGILTKYHFQQEVSYDEIKDLMPWLKENGNRLPKNALNYKKFEDLKDDIIIIDNKQRVKSIYNILPREQKNLINKNDKEFFEKALEVHKIGMMKDFTRKISVHKSRESLLNFMDEFIDKNSDQITFDSITNSLRELNSEIVFQDPDKGLVLAEIFDYPTSNKLGSTSWCISYSEGSWNSYTSGTKKQFFLWDFSVSRSDSNFMIGFTTNDRGQITNIHDKYDKSLRKSVPDNIKELLIKVDFSVDPFEYKNKILNTIDDNASDFTRVDDGSDQNIIVVYVKNNFSKLRQGSWGWFNPLNELYNVYIFFDFNKELNSTEFCYSVSTQINEGEITYITKDNDNKDDIQLNDTLNKYKELFVPKDVTGVYSQWKDEYLDKIEKYVKTGDSIKNHWGSAVYVNTSQDEGSTGRYWLFAITGDDSLFNKFKTRIIDSWGVMNNQDLVDFNMYVLIDIERKYNDPNFVRYICARDNGNSAVKYHVKENTTKKGLPEDIQKLVDEGYIQLKSRSDYQREYQERRKELFEKSRREYLDRDIDLYGKVLFEYLIEIGDLDEEDYMEYDEDDNPIGIPEDVHQKVLIPRGEHYGELKSFQVFNQNMITSRYGGSGKEWAIGDDNEADKAAYEAQQSLHEELGIDGYVSGYVDNFIDNEGLTNHLMDGEDYYFREEITDRPGDWDVERTMIDGMEEELEKVMDDHQKVIDKRVKVEERLEKYREWYKKKEDQIFKMIQEIEEEEEGLKRIEKLEKIEKRLEERFERNEERYENLIEKLEEKEEEIQDKIYEMEDEDNDEYWEYSEENIEEAVETAVNNRRYEISQDPVQYLKDMGYEGNSLKNMIEPYINVDEMIRNTINVDGRGNSLSSYDGAENEHNYNDKWYYIYRIN